MRRSSYTVFVLILLLAAAFMPLLAHEASGGSPMFSGNLRAVSGYNANRTQRPFDMEVDSGGRIYILYESDSKFLWGIFLTHSDDGGVTWSQPARVDDLLRDYNVSNDEIERGFLLTAFCSMAMAGLRPPMKSTFGFSIWPMNWRA